MAQHYDTNYEWNPVLIEKAQKTLLGRQKNIYRVFILWGVAVVWLAFASQSWSRLAFGEAMFALGMLVTTVLLMGAHRYRTQKLVHQLPHTEVSVHMDEEHLESTTQDTFARYHWHAFKEIQMTPDVTLLFPQRGVGVYIAMPTQAMSPEMQAFLVEKVEANGGKVVR
jgi:hypothetical protein